MEEEIMARPVQLGPTERELELLKLLWELGPSTVSEIRKIFPKKPKPAYNSLQTNLLAMLEKGLVRRNTDTRSHVYQAAVKREEVENSVIKDLVKRLFDGSALRLVITALSGETISSEEINRLQVLIEEKEKNG
jgi:BlaI family transcriptional regulator, penicillinase repressor